MFRKNDTHFQEQLFDSCSAMNTKNQQQLSQTWAPIYYEHVFCKMDESPFAVLYCADNGRPNFPVNILLSLEFFKHMYDITDDQLLEQYSYNYLINYAIGIRTLGERYLAPRTLYEFRERLYLHAIQSPEDDLIADQFEKLTEHFVKMAGIDTKEQRVDSTQIMPNIKRAGRLSLAYDVLIQAINACPSDMLTDSFKRVIEPRFKTEILFRCKGNQIKSRLQEIITLSAELLTMTEAYPEVHNLDAIRLLQRFLGEQATFDQEQQTWVIKENKDIAADSLQSAYDPDATYRRKGHKDNVGFVVNIAETCADENPVQLITDYVVAKNNANDAQMLDERLPVIKEKMEITDVYVDGGYYSEKVKQTTQDAGINTHFTDMTGIDPDPQKISLTEFKIDDYKIVVSCPEGQIPLKSEYKRENHKVVAHFDLNICQQCCKKDACPVKFQKKTTVLRVDRKALFASETRNQIKLNCKISTSRRAAIEGTNSALKRAHGAGELRVRTLPKSNIVIGMKIIAHNFRQIVRFLQGDIREKAKEFLHTEPQGVTASI